MPHIPPLSITLGVRSRPILSISKLLTIPTTLFPPSCPLYLHLHVTTHAEWPEEAMNISEVFSVYPRAWKVHHTGYAWELSKGKKRLTESTRAKQTMPKGKDSRATDPGGFCDTHWEEQQK